MEDSVAPKAEGMKALDLWAKRKGTEGDVTWKLLGLVPATVEQILATRCAHSSVYFQSF